MAILHLAPALIAGVFATGIVLAPAAMADRADRADSAGSAQSGDTRGPKTSEAGKRRGPDAGTSDYNSQIPQGWRNDAVWANPSQPGSNPFGSGKRPPVIALD